MSEQINSDTTWVHRQAGIAASFQWQDEGTSVSVDYTNVLGVLPYAIGEKPTYVVHVEGTADSGHGYTYPIEIYLTITQREDGTHGVDDATDEQIALAEQESSAQVYALDVFPVVKDLDEDEQLSCHPSARCEANLSVKRIDGSLVITTVHHIHQMRDGVLTSDGRLEGFIKDERKVRYGVKKPLTSDVWIEEY